MISRKKVFKSFYFRPSVTITIIALNVLAFILFYVSRLFFYLAGNESLALEIKRFLFLAPYLVVGGQVWTLLTSMFLHAGLLHLFVNMFSLFFLGNLVERIIGRKRYISLYLISGIIGGLFFVIFAYIGLYVPNGASLFGTPFTPAVGASGALFGLVGLLAVLIPRKEVYLISGPLIVIILQFVLLGFLPASVQGMVSLLFTVILFIAVMGMFSSNKYLRMVSVPLRLPFWLVPVVAIVPLFIIGFFVALPIGNTAHFGGLVVGLIYGFYLRLKFARKVVLLNRMVR